jgi:tetratricopeptide (TPR) repeat protein
LLPQVARRKLADRLLEQLCPGRLSARFRRGRRLKKKMASTSTLTQSEEAQLAQTIEMFEVITQSQPHDYQSLEILKEAYSKLGRESDVIGTSKRIAEAYVQMGQFSSAILEYETILQRFPEDPDVQAALKEIESKANNIAAQPLLDEPTTIVKASDVKPSRKIFGRPVPTEINDGRAQMHKVFVDGKIITAGDFDLCWNTPDLSAPPNGIVEPFIQVLADKGILQADTSLKILADKTRVAYMPLDKYDLDLDLARAFPAETCQRWCVLPFDRMSKSVMVATANPFNQQAAKELSEATANRLLWYLVPPLDLVKNLRKVFR